MTRRTKLSKGFEVDESVRIYTQKRWGLEFLGDVFLAEFIEVFTQNERSHGNWTTTLKTYIRNASPVGARFYRPWHWERKCGEAKRFRPPEERRFEEKSHKSPERDDYVAAGAGMEDQGTDIARRKDTWVPSTAGRQALKNIREYLK